MLIAADDDVYVTNMTRLMDQFSLYEPGLIMAWWWLIDDADAVINYEIVTTAALYISNSMLSLAIFRASLLFMTTELLMMLAAVTSPASDM